MSSTPTPTSTSPTKRSTARPPEPSLRILGIDPGSLATGYGVIEQKGGRLLQVECGSIVPGRNLAFLSRLSDIHDALAEIVDRFSPQEVAVESPFYHRNVRSMLQLGQAKAAALLPAIRAGLPIYEYAPRQIKLAVAGHGSAEKRQVSRMVSLLLGHSSPSSTDASDALAVAICHAHRSQSMNRLKKSLA